jgi:hypothetical protein
LVAVLVAGCSFDVIGVNVPAGAGSATPSPTQSVPSDADAAVAAAPPAPTPPNTPPPDMAQKLERVGVACTMDSDCDAGLFCAKSFGIGPGRVDIPGGYCTLQCGSAACPASSFCNDFGVLGKYCLSSCPPDPCRTAAGYVCCEESGGQHGCTPDNLCGGKKDN